MALVKYVKICNNLVETSLVASIVTDVREAPNALPDSIARSMSSSILFERGLIILRFPFTVKQLAPSFCALETAFFDIIQIVELDLLFRVLLLLHQDCLAVLTL